MSANCFSFCYVVSRPPTAALPLNPTKGFLPAHTVGFRNKTKIVAAATADWTLTTGIDVTARMTACSQMALPVSMISASELSGLGCSHFWLYHCLTFYVLSPSRNMFILTVTSKPAPCRLMEQLCGEAKCFILTFPEISGNLLITYANQLFPCPPLQTDAVK